MKSFIGALALFLAAVAAAPVSAQSNLTAAQKKAHEDALAAAKATIQPGGMLDGVATEKNKKNMPAASFNESGVPGAGSSGTRETNLKLCINQAKSGNYSPKELSTACESVIGSAGVEDGLTTAAGELTTTFCVDVVDNKRAPGTPLGIYCGNLISAKRMAIQNMAQRDKVRGGIALKPMNLTDQTKPPAMTGKDDITNSYSACTPSSRELPRATAEESCSIERVATRDNKCTKKFDPLVTWVCPEGATSGPRQISPATLGNGKNILPAAGHYVCTVPVPRDDYSCAAGFTGPKNLPVPPGNQPQPACTSAADGSVQAAIHKIVTEDKDRDATYKVEDRWTGNCEALEENTPMGHRSLNGGPPLPMAPFDSRPDTRRCGLSANTCTDVRTTATIVNDVPVSRTCWAANETFDCMTTETRTTCDPKPECQDLPERTCVKEDTDSSPASCFETQYKRSCPVGPVVKRDETSCETQTFCPGGGACWDTGYKSASDDFSEAILLFTGAQQGGRYYNANDQQLFKGYGGACREIHAAGIPINCCKKNAFGNFLYGALHMADNLKPGNKEDGKDENGKSMFDDKTSDYLFAADNSGMMSASLRGIESMTGEAKETWKKLKDGDIGKAIWGVFVTSPKAIADDVAGAFLDAFTAAITLFGILDGCNPDDGIMAEKRGKDLCVEVGTKVTEEVPIFGWWWTREHRSCCFNSMLAKLINDQGRAQIVGKGRAGDPLNASLFNDGANTTLSSRFGSAGAMNCRGFSPDQLKQIDFGKLDLKPFLATINPKLGSAADIKAQAKAMIGACAGGSAQCADRDKDTVDPSRLANDAKGKEKQFLSLRPLMFQAFPAEIGKANAVSGYINNEDIRLLSKYRFRKGEALLRATVWVEAEHSTMTGCRLMGVELQTEESLATQAANALLGEKSTSRPPIKSSVTFCKDGSSPGLLK